jgi:uncharacterized membrane protein
MLTFITGLLMLAYRGSNITSDITIGALLGTLMFMNVWMIIWPKQKIVIGSAKQVAEGGEADPNAAGALAKAGLASRTNTLFSMPMLFFMGSSMHMSSGLLMSASTTALVLIGLIILVLAGNGIMGKQGPMASVKGVIGCGLGLTVVLYGILALL